MSSKRRNYTKEVSMFRIGFDPILEAEQRHEEIMRDVERFNLIRQAEQCGRPKSRSSIKILALLGRRMAILGTNLVERYDERLEVAAGNGQQVASDNCY